MIRLCREILSSLTWRCKVVSLFACLEPVPVGRFFLFLFFPPSRNVKDKSQSAAFLVYVSVSAASQLRLEKNLPSVSRTERTLTEEKKSGGSFNQSTLRNGSCYYCSVFWENSRFVRFVHCMDTSYIPTKQNLGGGFLSIHETEEVYHGVSRKLAFRGVSMSIFARESHLR